MTDITQGPQNETGIPVTMQLTRHDIKPLDINQRRRLVNTNGVGCEFIVVQTAHEDGQITQQTRSLEALFNQPHRPRGTVAIGNPDDFIAYVKAHAQDTTELFYFANEIGAGFTAVLNGHALGDGHDSAFGWHDHKVEYKTASSRQWKTWTKHNNTPMKQSAFADFVEQNRLDFTAPDASTLLQQIVESMQATQSAAFTGIVRQANGAPKLAYEQTSKATAGQKGEITVPEKFIIGIPVFLDDTAYSIEAYFRYRITAEGALTISYQLINPEYTFEHVTEKLVKKIAEGISLPIYRGTPLVGLTPTP